MKKYYLVIITIILMIIFPVCAGAYSVGDVIGYALSTDIAATINGYDIPSYNVDGYTYVVVEDLQYYGFSVIYDNTSRSLSVTRDFSQMYVSKVYQKPSVSSANVGTRERKILYTDIVTYFDGYYVPACNIDGQTIVRFDSLSAYGIVTYDNNKREISLSLAGIGTNPNPTLRPSEILQRIQGYWLNGEDFISFEGKEFAYATYCSEYWHSGEITNIQTNNNSVVLTVDCPEKIMGYEEIYPRHVCVITISNTDDFKTNITISYPYHYDHYIEKYTFFYTAASWDEFYRIMNNRKL